VAQTPALEDPAIRSQAARCFLEAFLAKRKPNRDFYRGVPAARLDERVAPARGRGWDTARQSLVHQLYVTRNYVYSVRHGVLRWGIDRENLLIAPAALDSFDKQRLLAELDRVDRELAELLSEPDIESRRVSVAWSSQPVPALSLLERLLVHEVQHTGWNLALMRHLGVAP
jgi:uncharacterized damage-inducible protein DinB